MPVHDWTKVEAGDFHHFHHMWITFITCSLNEGGLPSEYMAMAEQIIGQPKPDVVALEIGQSESLGGGTALAVAPSARVVQKLESIDYAKRKDRVVIKHRRGRVVAIIELMSPGNKASRHAIRTFVEKSANILSQGIHYLVVDLFPPTPRDPQGIHKEIWDEFCEMPFDFLPDKPLTLASYIGGDMPTCFVETVGIGDPLPAMPVFLTETVHVLCPLEATYMQAWQVYPKALQQLMQPSETN